MSTIERRRRKRQSGSSMVEMCLLAPWIFFLFVGIFDFGFYAYELICIEGAAQVAAFQTATGPASATTGVAYQAAYGEMSLLPNNGSFTAVSSCSATASGTACGAAPLTVTQNTLCAKNTPSSVTCSARPTSTQPADAATDTASAASQVIVTYQGIQLIPIPGVLEGKLSLTRVAQMKILVP